jgi:uncharacterized membrane protein YkvI
MTVANTPRSILLLMLMAVMTSAGGCRAIEGIFKAGVWVGVVLAVIVVGAVVAIVSRLGS